MAKQTCTLYVSGMHCASCELLLEKKIKKMRGVREVKASLADKQVYLEMEQYGPNMSELNNEFAELGYSFTEKPLDRASFSFQSILSVMLIGIVFFIVFIILEDTQILANVSVNQNSSIIAFFMLGVVASLSTCAALVGGLLLSLSKQWNGLYGGNEDGQRVKPFIMFNVGRLISYALLGAALGFVGSFFTISLQYTAILVMAVSVVMILLGLQMLGVGFAKKIKLTAPRFISGFISDEKHFKGKYMPFIVGSLTFFIPCGFTLMAQTVSLTTGNPIQSMIMMSAFALGTLPVLAILSFSSIKFQKNITYAGTFNLLIGLFIIGFGIYNVNSQLNVLGMRSLSDIRPAPVQTVPTEEGLGVQLRTVNGQEYQYMTLKAQGFGYFPQQITLKAGVPVRLIVKNQEVVGCAQAMYMPGLYDEVLYLTGPETRAEFTPEKTGTFKISCTMGMVQPIIVTVKS